MIVLEDRIVVKMILSQDLVLRHNVKILFDEIENVSENPIIVDFKDVRTMTRSFAQEYLFRKSMSLKAIVEMNVSQDIRKMFKVAETESKKTKLIDLRELVILDME